MKAVPCGSYADEIYDLALEPWTDEVVVTWATAGGEGDSCPATTYLVSWELVNKGQCGPDASPAPAGEDTVGNTTFTVGSLWPYSTYRVHVRPSSSPGTASTRSNQTTTKESGNSQRH